jgi:hypothetical protein
VFILSKSRSLGVTDFLTSKIINYCNLVTLYLTLYIGNLGIQTRVISEQNKLLKLCYPSLQSRSCLFDRIECSFSVICKVNKILSGGSVYRNHDSRNEGNRLSGFVLSNSHKGHYIFIKYDLTNVQSGDNINKVQPLLVGLGRHKSLLQNVSVKFRSRGVKPLPQRGNPSCSCMLRVAAIWNNRFIVLVAVFCYL